MKFYYNDKLIRTSKNHVYTHAVIDTATGECKGCRGNKEAAEALVRSVIAEREKWIAEKRTAIRALEAGKRYYVVKERGRSYPIYFNSDSNVEDYVEGIELLKARIDTIEKTWAVVELEAK